MISVQLFGAPQILEDQQPVSINRRKSRALVYYLADQDHPLIREQLLAFFWPDHERNVAQQTLRSMIHGIRQALGASLVISEYQLWIQADVDVRSFRGVLDRPTGKPVNDAKLLHESLALYRGDFLEGFSLPDADNFNAWARQQQEMYRRLAIRGITTLSRIYASRQDFANALDTLDRGLQVDPLQEDLLRDLLRLLYQSGDRASAIRRYDAFRKRLDEELGVPPMAETRAIYDSILVDPPDQAPVFPPTTKPVYLPSPPPGPTDWVDIPFIGRQSELSQIREGLARGNLVLVEGEPGIGKTRLVEEYTRSLNNIVLTSTARELEMVLPYQPWRSALRGLMNQPDWPALRQQIRLAEVWEKEVTRLFPEYDPGANDIPTGSSPDESRLWEGLHQFLLALSQVRPMLIFLDDLHWADSASLGLLGYLVRQPDLQTGRSFFLAACHAVPAGSPLGKLTAALSRENRITRVTPTRLTPAEIGAIAQALSPTSPEVLSEWLARNSEGNPYFLMEQVRYARAKGLLQADGLMKADVLSSGPVVPQNVYSLIETRLARLSDEARQVMDAAVAAGREFEVDVVLEASGLVESQGWKGLAELEAFGVVCPASADGRYYSFDHSLLMEVAYREAGEARHRRFHRRIAEALEKLYQGRLEPVAGLLASHFEEGNAPLKAAPYARQAAALAEKLAAWQQAIDFYKQALRDDDDAHNCIPTWLALGNIYDQIGGLALASEARQNALDLANELGEVAMQNQVQLSMGNSYLTQAHFSEAIAAARQVLSTGVEGDALDAEFLWGTALSISGVDLDQASQHLEAATKMCAAGAAPEKKMRIEFEMGSVAAQRGDLKQAVALYRASLQTSLTITSNDQLQWRVLAYNNLAYHLHLLGDAQAEQYAREGLSLSQSKGILNMRPYLLSTLGEICLDHGELGLAGRYFQEGLDLAEKLSMVERIAGLTANLGRLASRQGDREKAIQLLFQALDRADSIGARHLAVQIRIWLAPLLPRAEGLSMLEEARRIAPPGSALLQKDIRRVEQKLHAAADS